jgi:histidinol-phosphate aminotransferase
MSSESIFKKLANKYLEDTETYIPGPLMSDITNLSGLDSSKIIKLSSNENPLGPPSMAIEAIKESIKIASIYPDSQSKELRNEIGKFLGFGAENIVVGAGSSETMSFIVRAFSSRMDEVICLNPSFTLYREIASTEGRRSIIVELKPDEFAFNPDDLKKAIGDKTKVIFLTRPNNPTSRCMPLKAVKEIADFAPNAIIVSDEAYVEFADNFRDVSAVSLIGEDSNVLVTRTFSKAFGLGGLRVGYTVGPKTAIDYLSKVKPKWNVGSLVQNAAIGALRDKEHFIKTLSTVNEGRKMLVKELREIGFGVVPEPQGNFLMVKVSPVGFTSKQFFIELAKKGISIRGGQEDVGKNHVRISIGTKTQNIILIENIKEIMKA